MKKLALYLALVAFVCLNSSFINLKTTHIKHTTALQTRVQPFCKFTYLDQRGRATKMSTDVVHANSKSLTFVFEGGEKLILGFATIRPGHFVAESARSRDPQILFFPAHNANPIPMVGAVIISRINPVSGNFSHLVSDDDEHITLVAGTFSL